MKKWRVCIFSRIYWSHSHLSCICTNIYRLWLIFLKLHPMKFPAPLSEILQKECTHIETSTNYLTEMSRYVNNTKPNMNLKWMLFAVMVLLVMTAKLLWIDCTIKFKCYLWLHSIVKNIDIYSHRYTLMALTQLPIYIIHIILIVCSDTPVPSHIRKLRPLPHNIRFDCKI